MDNVPLSDLERYYLIQGTELGCRMDGRSPHEYRPIELETGMLSHASGSASIRIGETNVLGCVKIEVGKPSLLKPSEGRIELHVECYPTALSASTDKGAAELADQLKSILQTAYRAELLDLKRLCIEPGRQCWVIYVDLLLLEGDGNFLDAASMVIKAAMLNAMQTHVASPSANVDRATDQVRCSERTMPTLDDKLLPIFVTVHKVGTSHLVDATREEEACSLSRLSVAVYPDGVLGALQQEGCGSCHVETVVELAQLATSVGQELNTALMQTLKFERELRSA